jgi:hypothetical protein
VAAASSRRPRGTQFVRLVLVDGEGVGRLGEPVHGRQDDGLPQPRVAVPRLVSGLAGEHHAPLGEAFRRAQGAVGVRGDAARLHGEDDR